MELRAELDEGFMGKVMHEVGFGGEDEIVNGIVHCYLK